MAFNLFDFSSLGGASSLVKPAPQPSQVGGATGGGNMPPTITSKPLPRTPIAPKPSTPTVVPERQQVDIRTKVQQNLPKLQAELKRQGVVDEDMGEILQGIVDASLQGTKQPELSAGKEGVFSKAISALPSNIAEPIERVVESFQTGIAKAATTPTTMNPLDPNSWKGAAGIGEALFSPLSALDGKAAEIASKPFELISKGIEAPLEFAGVSPETAKNVASTLLSAAPFVKGAVKPLATTAEIVNKPISLIKEKLAARPVNPVVKPIPKLEKQINAKTADWEAPAKEAKLGVKKSAQMLKRGEQMGTKPSETLVRNGILAEDNIKSGNFDTLDTSNSLRTDTIKVSSDILRPALKEASVYTPKVSVAEITQKALDSLEKKRTKMTAAEYKAQKSVIMNESKGLSEQYPQGLDLENLHDKRIVSDDAARYNKLGTIADNNTAAGYKTLADVERALLEEKVPPSIPIKKFNSELAKLFQAADFLESLHGKKAPISPIKKIASYAAKLTGASLGQAGGLAGSAAGYQIGGLLENLLVTMPSPFRKKFIENVSKTSPDVFKQMQKSTIKTGSPTLKEYGYSLENRPAIVKKKGDKYVVLQGTGRFANAKGEFDIFLPKGETLPKGFSIVNDNIPNNIVKEVNLLSSRGEKGSNPKMIDFITKDNTEWVHIRGPKTELIAPLIKKP